MADVNELKADIKEFIYTDGFKYAKNRMEDTTIPIVDRLNTRFGNGYKAEKIISNDACTDYTPSSANFVVNGNIIYVASYNSNVWIYFIILILIIVEMITLIMYAIIRKKKV